MKALNKIRKAEPNRKQLFSVIVKPHPHLTNILIFSARPKGEQKFTKSSRRYPQKMAMVPRQT